MYEPKDNNPTGYEPEVDDYVIWDQGEYGRHEGWVYFKCDPVDNEQRVKNGWNPIARYITIEIGVKPKPTCMYSSGKPMQHKMIHILLLCNDKYWHELRFVKRRNSKECQHYSQYDDVHGNEESTYKSQEHRYTDIQ